MDKDDYHIKNQKLSKESQRLEQIKNMPRGFYKFGVDGRLN